jgi:hypothetical protein
MPTVSIGNLAILWGIRKFGQIAEAFVGRAQCLHGGEPTFRIVAEKTECAISRAATRWTAANHQLEHGQIFRSIACPHRTLRTILLGMSRLS